MGFAPFSSPSIYRPFDRLTFFSHSPFLPHFLLGLSRSFRPTRFFVPSLPLLFFSPSGLPSSRPQPSRSFRPTRLSAAFTCLKSSPSPFFSPFPLSLSSTAGTQSVIPAHSVLDCPPPSPPSSHLSPSLLP